jgi:iron complex outermembrane receptor protein
MLLVISVMVYHRVRAQGRLDKDTIKMKEVELVAQQKKEKLLLKSIAIDSSDLHNHQSETLTGLLSQSSVFIKDYGASMVASPGFRGTAEDQTKTYWNGIPLNSSMYGIQDLNLVPAFLLDGVTINYGGASLAGGSGGFGGSLDLQSDPKNEPYKAEWISTIGSFGEIKNCLGYNYGSDKFWGSTKVYYGSAQNNFPYVNTFQWNNPVQTEQDASMYQNGILQSLGWQLTSKDILKADIWYQNSFRNLPQTMISNDNTEYQKDESLRSVINYTHYALGYNWGLDGSFVKEYLYYYNQLSAINSLSDNERYELKGNFNPEFSLPLSLKTGISDVEETANIQEYEGLKKSNKSGIWADANYQLSKRWIAGLVMRMESINFSASQLAGTGSIAYRALKDDKLDIHINGGRNFNYPNLNDLYWYPGGNPNLQPEHTWFAEAGLSSVIPLKGDNELKAELTAFSNLVDNYIQWTPQGGSYWEAQNLKTVWARGIESAASFSHKWRSSTLLLRGAWQYTPSTDESPISAYDQTVGRQLIYVPIYTAQASAKLNVKKYNFTAEYTYTGMRNTTDIQLPAYSLVNVFIGRSFVMHKLHFDLLAKCNNLFNTSYQAIVWRPMPGRWYEINLRITV